MNHARPPASFFASCNALARVAKAGLAVEGPARTKPFSRVTSQVISLSCAALSPALRELALKGKLS